MERGDAAAVVGELFRRAAAQTAGADGDERAQILAEALQQTRLTTVNLYGRGVGVGGAVRTASLWGA